MKIYLIRHGEKEGDDFSSILTEKGRRQIEILSENIKDLDFEKIYSSSNFRSVESAEIICLALGKNFEKLDNIREFKKDLFFEGLDNIDLIEKTYYENLISFIDRIEKESKNVCLVMNAGINRAIICHLLKYPLNRAITLTQGVASITELEKKEIYGKKEWCINSINKTYTRKWKNI
jgi:broad specificity phosphatase PhoE